MMELLFCLVRNLVLPSFPLDDSQRSFQILPFFVRLNFTFVCRWFYFVLPSFTGFYLV